MGHCRISGRWIFNGLRRKYIPKYEKTTRKLFPMTEERLDAAIENAEIIVKHCQSAGTDDPSTKIHELVLYLKKLKQWHVWVKVLTSEKLNSRGGASEYPGSSFRRCYGSAHGWGPGTVAAVYLPPPGLKSRLWLAALVGRTGIFKKEHSSLFIMETAHVFFSLKTWAVPYLLPHLFQHVDAEYTGIACNGSK